MLSSLNIESKLTEENKYLICLLMFKENNDLHILPPDYMNRQGLLESESYNHFYIHSGHDIVEKGFYMEWLYNFKKMEDFESLVYNESNKTFDKECFIKFIKELILSRDNKYINFIKKHCDYLKTDINELIPLLDYRRYEELFDVFLKNDDINDYIEYFCHNSYKMRPSYLYAIYDIGCFSFSQTINLELLLKTLMRIALDKQMVVYGESFLKTKYMCNDTYILRLSSNSNIYEYINILNILFQFSANISVDSYVALDNNLIDSLGHKIILYFKYITIEIYIINEQTFKNHVPYISTFSLATENINGKDHIYSLSNDSPFEIMKLIESKIIKLNNIETLTNIYNIVDTFYNISWYVDQGWTFDNIIPFNLSNLIIYNIKSSTYIDILTTILTKDVATIINE